jgi:hypothetical protein
MDGTVQRTVEGYIHLQLFLHPVAIEPRAGYMAGQMFARWSARYDISLFTDLYTIQQEFVHICLDPDGAETARVMIDCSV